ncbi:MAG TPA: xanthine dehydrogenase family protein subunit M [Burkholderiales bacterium]|nr:xanthine dehydrogenase family protein subunit M [Burkholderiales bacterium]
MKPPPFSYHDPQTVPEVIDLLGRLENARLLAGGQSLMPMLNMRFALPDHLIDLNRIDGLAYIRVSNGALEIGAMTRQRDIECSALVREQCPLMHEAIAHVGHRQTRNRGTLGGSLCHLDPAAELVAVAAALDATVEIAGPKGRREIPFARFPKSYMTPAMAPDEMLTGVRFPRWGRRYGYAFVEFARRHGDFAIVSAAALLEEDDAGRIARAAVTIGGVGPAPVRAAAAESALVGNPASEPLFQDACESCREIDAVGDVHAPAPYRQHLAAVLAKRALEQAHARTGRQ